MDPLARALHPRLCSTLGRISPLLLYSNIRGVKYT